jgi:hypothetical protein
MAAIEIANCHYTATLRRIHIGVTAYDLHRTVFLHKNKDYKPHTAQMPIRTLPALM